MDHEEVVTETRQLLGQASLVLIDAIDDESLEAMGKVLNASREFIELMRARDVPNDALTSLLIGGMGRLIYGGDDD